MTTRTARLSWADFAAEIAAVAPRDASIEAETRLFEDLGLDSVSLVELVVLLIDELELSSLSQHLESVDWEKVTVGSLYEDFVAPPREQSSTRPGVRLGRGAG